ncbi:MAG: nucleoside monophosphate kinase [Patescibacteria group bacterium]
MPPQTFIFFGRSGSGKGTQARLLLEYLKKEDSARSTLYLETGQELREFSKTKSYTARLTKDTLSSGALLPGFVPIWLWTDYLIKHFSGQEHLIFDGISRRSIEAEVLDSALEFYKREAVHIILINISKEWASARLLERGRSDDNKDDIEKRLNWYDDSVTESLKFFRNNKKYIFCDIDGEQEIEKVYKDIVAGLSIK